MINVVPSGAHVSALAEMGFVVAPEVADLCLLLCPFPLVPFPALRYLRLALRGRHDSHIEQDVCDSSLVQCVANDGFEFHADARRRMIELLKSAIGEWDNGQREGIERFWRRTQWAGRLSPLLGIELAIAVDYVTTSPDAYLIVLESRLRDIFLSAAREHRRGILYWYSAARRRMPSDCFAGASAWALSQWCQAENIEYEEVPPPEQCIDFDIRRLPVDLPYFIIGVGRYVDHLEFGVTSPSRPLGIVADYTNPIVLTISDFSASVTTIQRVIWAPPKAPPVSVACGRGVLRIGTLSAVSYTLKPLDGDTCLEMVSATTVTRRMLDAQARRARLDSTIVRSVAGGFVVYIADLECTAYLPSDGQAYDIDQKLCVVVHKVFPKTRWMSVLPAPEHSGADNAPKPITSFVPSPSVPPGVSAGDAFRAVVLSHGQIKSGKRSAYVALDPMSPMSVIQHYDYPMGRMRFGAAVSRESGEWRPATGSRVEVACFKRDQSGAHFLLRILNQGDSNAQWFDPVRGGENIVATVRALFADGAELLGPDGRWYWLRRVDMFPFPSIASCAEFGVGELVRLHVLRATPDDRGYYRVSQHLSADWCGSGLRIGSRVGGYLDRVEIFGGGRFCLVALDRYCGVLGKRLGAIGRRSEFENVRAGTRVDCVVERVDAHRREIVVRRCDP
jgi:hypothetical protein